jgi:glycosyltransferase involved in cell wall biosynthesis
VRVIILGTRGFPNVQGGVEKHCQDLATRLAKLGCDIIVFTRRPYVDKNIEEFEGVKLVALPAIRHKSLEVFLHTFIGVFAALRYRPDILHIQAIGPALFTPLARIMGMKVVVTSHGSNYKHPKWGKFAKLVLRLGEFMGASFANEVIVVSNVIADEIRKKYNRKAIVIPNGVVIPHIAASENTLQKYGLEKGKYILNVGRFVPVKGGPDLILAFNELQTDGWKLVIVGSADHESEYSRILKERAAENQDVILTGFLSGDPLQELYSHAGLFVLPSYYEGLPLVLLEAMSYGLLCVASDIPANRCVELPDENYFTAGDIIQLSEKLKDFTKKSLTSEQKSRQIEMVREMYDWDKIARQTLKVYNKVVYG